MFQTRDILKTLRDKMLTVCDTVFDTDRPESTRERMKEFIVVSLPVIQQFTVHGGDLLETTCRVEIFVRDEDGKEHTNRLCELIERVSGLFPLKASGLFCTGVPTLVMEGSDRNGFHAAALQADLYEI